MFYFRSIHEHKRANLRYEKLQPYKIPPLNPKPVTGYKQRDEDLLFKIQGTTGLDDRCESFVSEIHTCHFASLYAILFAMHYPIEKWNYRKIDMCIENAINLEKAIEGKEICLKREIQNVQVEDMLYNILITGCDSNYKTRSLSLKTVLGLNFQRCKYLILQFPNCSFGLVKDQLYHIFDPYKSMDVCHEMSKEETEDLECKRSRIQGMLDKEQNKASWILCINVEEILNYIVKRTNKQKINKEYLLYRVSILNYKKAKKDTYFSHLLYKSCDHEEQWLCGYSVEEHLHPEEIQFIEKTKIPPWSRLNILNIERNKRKTYLTTWKEYDVEIQKEVYSLWGNLSPVCYVFKGNRAKQYLAINTISIAMALLYPLDEWNPEILDSIVINGDLYFSESIENISEEDHELKIYNLNSEFEICNINLQFRFESVLHGMLYDTNMENFNLSRALTYFFRHHQFGILNLTGRTIAIGKSSTFFMFDCQSFGSPLFIKDQGTAYVLRCCSLRRLLECILITLNVKRYCVRFALYSVSVDIGKQETDLDVFEDEIEDEIEQDNVIQTPIVESENPINEEAPEWISRDFGEEEAKEEQNFQV